MGSELEWGWRGSSWGRRGWNWVRRGLSQGVRVGEVRGVRGVGVEGVWVEVGLGLGNSEGWGRWGWGVGSVGVRGWVREVGFGGVGEVWVGGIGVS